MGANVYLTAVASYGYDTESAATVITRGIPGRPGERIAIRSFGLTPGGTATNAYFMQVLGSPTTLVVAVASGGSTLNLTAQPVTGNEVAVADYLAVVLTDGSFHFSKVGALSAGGLSAIVLCTVLTGAAAILNTVYFFGAMTDDGHVKLVMAASTQRTQTLDGGMFFGTAKGYPVLLHHDNDATAAGTIDWLTVDYINK